MAAGAWLRFPNTGYVLGLRGPDPESILKASVYTHSLPVRVFFDTVAMFCLEFITVGGRGVPETADPRRHSCPWAR